MATRAAEPRETDDGERWLSVSEAAEVVGVSGAAIRAWSRAGRIPSRRGGDGGDALVPLSAILRLGAEVDDDDVVIDLDADGDADASDDDLMAMHRALDDARRQVAFLRDQLAESAAGERAAVRRAEAAEAELARLRSRRRGRR
jgi:hypothetical protein